MKFGLSDHDSDMLQVKYKKIVSQKLQELQSQAAANQSQLSGPTPMAPLN